ncbi:MAG: WXG100 family type VII secretion target [Synergistaceae bacterium]|jgi:WXG100 family type VII secretion target|nr:WXG100 family type VII secretion target [Synergistaceae bacterium]
MANIKITPESLRTHATTLRKHNETHRQAYASMDSLVHNLASEWTGEAQTAFLATFDGNKPSFEKFGIDIDAFAKLMDDSANRMEQTDQEIKAKMTL